MKKLSDIERRARAAIRHLRERTLLNGEPFMVYDTDLPSGQYYMEYPEGDIKIVTVSYQKNDFIVREELSTSEVHDLRRRLELPPVFPPSF